MNTTTLFVALTAASAFATYCAVLLVEVGGIAPLLGTVSGTGLFIMLALYGRRIRL